VQFRDFGLLHYFEEHETTAKKSISFSDMLPFHLKEFGKPLEDLDLSHTTGIGDLEFRKRIGAVHGVPPDHVMVTNGASEANFAVHAALLDRGDEAIIESPTYPPLRNIPMGLAGGARDAARDPKNWALDLSAVRRLATPKTKLLVLTNLNNPTSGLLDTGQLSDIAVLAREKGFHVHVDETFRDLAFDRAPKSAASLGDRMISTGTVTKVYGLGGLRIGWVVASPAVLKRVKNVKDYLSVTPAWPSEVLALWALERRDFFLDRARTILTENRKTVREWLERNPKVHWDLEDQGSIAFPRLDGNVAKLAERLLREHGTILAPGHLFGFPDRFRLGYGRDPALLRQGLEAFDKVLRSL